MQLHIRQCFQKVLARPVTNSKSRDGVEFGAEGWWQWRILVVKPVKGQ
jgi:hypothetical protein